MGGGGGGGGCFRVGFRSDCMSDCYLGGCGSRRDVWSVARWNVFVVGGR